MHVQWVMAQEYRAIANLDRICFPLADHWSSGVVELFLTEPINAGLVVKNRGKVVAFALYSVTLPKARCIVQRLAVHPDWRRRGAGTLLVAEIIDRVHTLAPITFLARVPEGNLPCQCLLRRAGFTCTATIKGRPGEGDEYVFTRAIGAEQDSPTREPADRRTRG